MKVVCIDDRPGRDDKPNIPNVKKGNVYHVIDTHKLKGKVYYVLIEMGNNFGYWRGMFLEINENQKDETELIRNYKTETV